MTLDQAVTTTGKSGETLFITKSRSNKKHRRGRGGSILFNTVLAKSINKQAYTVKCEINNEVERYIISETEKYYEYPKHDKGTESNNLLVI